MYVLNDVHYFSNITDFVNSVKDAPTLRGRNTASMDRDYDFTKTNTIDEAWEMLEKGDIGTVGDKILDNLRKLNIHPTHSKQFNDVVGFAPHVPNYLMGVPQTMVNREIKIYRDKIVNILVNNSVNAYVSTDDIVRMSTSVFEVVLKLEREGYRVNLYKMIGSSVNDKRSVLGFIKMKDDKERINLKKLIFPMTHPSMQRRLDFRFRECYGLVDVTHDGYGSQHNWSKEFVDRSFKRLCPNDYLYANLCNFDENWYTGVITKEELESE